jgi:hypothetical protein
MLTTATAAACVLWSAHASVSPASLFAPDPSGASMLRGAALIPHDTSTFDALTAEEVALASPVLAQVRLVSVTTSPVVRYSTVVRAAAYDLSGRTRRSPLLIDDTGPYRLMAGQLPIVSLFAPSGSAHLVIQPSLGAVGFIEGDAALFRRAGGGEESYPLGGHNLFACLIHGGRACRATRLAAFGVATSAQLRAFSDLALDDPLATMEWMLIRTKDRTARFPDHVCSGSASAGCASSKAFRRRSGFQPSQ